MATVAELTAIYDRLMSFESLARFEDAKALECLAHLIDLSSILNRDDGHDKAFAWCTELEKRSLQGTDVLLLDYYRANAWANRVHARHRDADAAWLWNQPEVLEQILLLRRVTRRKEFDDWDAIRRAQVLTNLGNQLNSLGRFVEAVPLWTRALLAQPHFGMALGNRGLGLSEYARGLYDPGHQSTFLYFAHSDLSAALSDAASFEHGYQYDDAKAAFAARKTRIEELIDVSGISTKPRLDGYPLGDSEEERRYRQWALKEGLFLNPLNDLGAHPIAARDIFNLPHFVTGIKEPPTLIGLFNQMKQEYVSARWMLYDGMNADVPHFSDRDVALHNTFDYPSYSIAVEKVKAAYRMAYALFDKVAFFLDDYMKLKIDPKKLYFRRVWYKNQDAKNGGIRDELGNLKNWPWRGLFWLSKDLFDPVLQDSAEPDAQQLYIIRNCLEHSYLKVHEMMVPHTSDDDFWHDRLAYSVQREDFCRKTLRVLRLSRAALIYLSLGMHSEEQKRRESKPDAFIAEMPLHLLEDERRI